MPELSDRFALPLLNAGQAQKEIYHNEALALLDLLAQAAVEDHDLDTPPSSPVPGQCWVVGASPTGAWAGQAGKMAGWTSGGWRFIEPRAGMAAWDIGNGYWLRHDGSSWRAGEIAALALEIGGIQVVGSQQSAIVDPAGGSVIDTQARDVLALVLSALRMHGLIAP